MGNDPRWFTNFIDSDTPTFFATLYIAFCLLVIQIICHPIWTLFGDRFATLIAGKKYERFFMWFSLGNCYFCFDGSNLEMQNLVTNGYTNLQINLFAKFI